MQNFPKRLPFSCDGRYISDLTDHVWIEGMISWLYCNHDRAYKMPYLLNLIGLYSNINFNFLV